MKTITKIIYSASAAFALACFALLPTAQAVSPAPDGGYFNGNTAEGDNALLTTNGSFNTAIGDDALASNNGGNINTATGAFALEANITGGGNTANGFSALLNNKNNNNTATGCYALMSNTTGSSNTANGFQALFTNNGIANTATGVNALYNNTTGANNTATGVNALRTNNTGSYNTADGDYASFFNTTGNYNTAEGALALSSNGTGSNNIALGFEAGLVTIGNNDIDIGNLGASENDTIRIGVQGTQMAAYIAGIFSETVGANNLPVLIDTNGKLGTAVTSSRRFKNEIKAMDKASEAILALKPVTFHYNEDKTNTPQFGLIAEEVAEVNRDLVVRDKHGQICAVRYDAVNAMLLNEFLKEHRKVGEQQGMIGRLETTAAKQEATIGELKKDFRATVAQLTTRLDEQAAQIQKVSAQLEASKPAPQVVQNNP